MSRSRAPFLKVTHTALAGARTNVHLLMWITGSLVVACVRSRSTCASATASGSRRPSPTLAQTVAALNSRGRAQTTRSRLGASEGVSEQWYSTLANTMYTSTRLAFLLVEAVGDSSGSRLVDDTDDVQTGNCSRVLGCLALSVVEVGGHRDDGVLDILSKIGFSDFLHLDEDHGRHLLRRKLLVFVVDFDLNMRFVVLVVELQNDKHDESTKSRANERTLNGHSLRSS